MYFYFSKSKKVSMILCVLLALSCTPIFTGEKNSDFKKVKVGYCQDCLFQDGASEGAIKTGYGYEYLQRVASITGWKYEYVYGSWDDLYKSLLSGEIDIFGGIEFTYERLDAMLFPDFPQGYESNFIYVSEKNSRINENLGTLQGKTIGTLSGSMEKMLINWLSKNSINANLKIYFTQRERNLALENGEVDAILSGNTSGMDVKKIRSIVKIENSPIYLCVSKYRPDLLDQLNKALSELNMKDPYFISELSKKYFNKTASRLALTPSEEKWLDQNTELRIGYFSNYLPYCDTDSEENVTGIVKDVTEKIMLNLGIDDRLKVSYRGFKNSREMEDALLLDKVDVIFPVSEHAYFLEQIGVFHSKEIISATADLVYKGHYSQDKIRTIAINKHNKNQGDYTMTYFPARHYKYYSSIRECLNAVVYDEADCTILSGLRTRDLLRENAFTYLKHVTLPNLEVNCFGVKNTDISLLSLLNRGIDSLDKGFAITSTYSYAETKNYSLLEFVKEHIVLVSFFQLLLVTLIISLFATFEIKTRKNAYLQEISHKDSMTGLLNRRAYEEELEKLSPVPTQKSFSYIVMDLNALKKTNDTFGHAAGDELIRGTADCLSLAFRGDKIFRIGGDEFVCIVYSDAEELTQKISEFCRLAAKWKGELTDSLSVSFGGVRMEDYPHMDLSQLIKHADKVMYENKNAYYRAAGIDRRV